jgi:hypothetical protein
MPTPRRMLSMGPPKHAENPMMGAKTFVVENEVSVITRRHRMVTYRHAHVSDKICERIPNSKDCQTYDGIRQSEDEAKSLGEY